MAALILTFFASGGIDRSHSFQASKSSFSSKPSFNLMETKTREEYEEVSEKAVAPEALDSAGPGRSSVSIDDNAFGIGERNMLCRSRLGLVNTM